MTTLLGTALTSLLVCLGTASAQSQKPTRPVEKQTNTPGMSLAYEEKSRGTEHGLELVHVTFKAAGFPKDQRYALYGQWMTGQSKEVVRDMRIDESGSVRTADGDEFDLSLGGMFLGEYVKFGLVSEDAASKAFVEITPFPIQDEGTGGCRLFVRPMEASGQAFSITGSGFKPNEDLKIHSTSSNESGDSKVKGRDDGSLKFVLFPATVGRKGGDATFQASDSTCTVNVSYKWGEAMRAFVPEKVQPTPSAP